MLLLSPSGQYVIQKVVPQATGESSKVKVKVRMNVHGIFSVSSASLVEVQKSDDNEEPMETEQPSEKEEEVLQCWCLGVEVKLIQLSFLMNISLIIYLLNLFILYW